MDETSERWDEAALSDLEPHEHDFQEFKGSAWMLTSDGALHPNFPLFLAKQVSAFANGAGGRIFIGLDDSGTIDGGVPVDLKGGGTRAWLEDIVPTCVDPHLKRCNVFEVARSGPNSAVKPNCAVYVIHVPSSTDAPHQGKDNRYYLRIAGKSRPMGHLHIQDVLRRTRHPVVSLSRFGPYGRPHFDQADSRGPRAFLQFRAFVTNAGRTLANHVGVELTVPRPLAGREVRVRMAKAEETIYTQQPGELTYFRYHPVPLFPGQEVYVVSLWICLHANNLVQVRDGAKIKWRIYADDAVPVEGVVALWDYQNVQRAITWVTNQMETS